MAFTAEDLMAMQKEAEAVHAASLGSDKGDKSEQQSKEQDQSQGGKQDDAKKDDGAEDKSVKKEGVEGGEAKAKEDEKGAVAGKEGGEKEKGKEKEVIEDDEEVRELREITRAQKAELDKVTKEYERLTKILKDKGLIDEDDEKAKQEQEQFAKVNYEKRLSALSDILEVMKVNPKYEDVDDVVSQRHFDDMVAALTKYYVSQQGGNPQQVSIEIEREIWSLANPYKYMYEMIKKYHPEYATQKEDPKKKEEEDKGKESVAKEKVEATVKEFKEQAMSLQDLPGGSGKDGGGWTSAKIDGMDEEELSKVPKDIYEKYLKGTLQ